MAAWICKSVRTHLRTSLSTVVLLSCPLFRDEKEGRKWSRWLLFLPGAITFGLGTWQISRRQDKIEMLDYRRKRLEMEPIMLNQTSLVDKNFDSLKSRRVYIYAVPRSRSISGVTENDYYAIPPLYLAIENSDRFPPRKNQCGKLQDG